MPPKFNSLPPFRGDEDREILDSDFEGTDDEKGQDVLRMTEDSGSETDFELSDDERFKSDSDQERQVLSQKAAEVPDLEVDESIEKIIRKKRKRNKNRPILMWEVWEEEYARWLASYDDAYEDTDNQHEVVAETAEAPPSFVMPLMKYQKEWLAWALKQEESAARGGILADEKGMGKTIQAIALVMAKKELNRALDGALPSTSQSSGSPQVKATLVICPLVGVAQWVNEISRSTLKGSNKVLVYNGAKKAKTLDEFSEYDFVITTYSSVEAEYRKYVLPPTRECRWCGKWFTEKNMNSHQSYSCGPDVTYKPSKQRKNKNAGADVDDGNCNLRSLNWNRIILDEIRFLQISPYSYYFCKDCDCRTLDYRVCTEKLQTSCDIVIMKYITTPIQSKGNSGSDIDAMILLEHKILKSILLRRTKMGRSADLALPPKMVLLRRDSLDIFEESYYTALYNESRAQFNIYVAEDNVGNNYAHISDLLTRLRQAVDHPYLVLFSKAAKSRNLNEVLDANNGELICGLCNGSAEDPLSGVQCVQLDGTMTTKARNAAIKRFTEVPDCRLLLMSFKTGGVALNLTMASHVFLMDPWWNPDVERQAQDRIHRIGQFKPTRQVPWLYMVVRFITEGTIEERILKVQEEKELVFEGTIVGSSNGLGRLTEDDMKFLFEA
ncbi:hypothetical protein AgCh_003020 [Apium graveolens]